MEELTKTQIVLLTLLVSFVTSIATGIVTVALVDQSSQGVGQTIQTVIQKTIETVAPVTATTEVKPKPTPPPTPSEGDQIVQAVAKNSAALVRIKKANTPPDHAFVALGIIINKNGTLITDHGLLAAPADYVAVLPDGKEATLTASTLNASTTNVAIFNFTPPDGIHFTTLGDSDKLSLGQKVISLTGTENDTVSLGVIASFNKGNSANNDKAFINTDIDTSTKSFGSILIDLAGDVVGMKTAVSQANNTSYQGINTLKSEMK